MTTSRPSSTSSSLRTTINGDGSVGVSTINSPLARARFAARLVADDH